MISTWMVIIPGRNSSISSVGIMGATASTIKMEEPVYNPLSINRFMKNGCEFRSYWDDTEETEFASEITKSLTDEELFKYPSISGSQNTFTVPTYEHESEYDSLTMLFFSGYLTVKEGSEYHILDLDFPNEEAKNAFKVFIRKE